MSTRKINSEQAANISQDAQQTQLAPRTAYKPRKTVKSPATQTAVLTKRALGDSKAKIARDLGIANNTVTSIIELNNFEQEQEAGRIGCIKLIPKSIQSIEKTLDKGDGYLGIKLLTGLGILGQEQKAKSMSVAPNLHLQIMNLVGKPPDLSKDLSVDAQVVDNKDVG